MKLKLVFFFPICQIYQALTARPLWTLFLTMAMITTKSSD